MDKYLTEAGTGKYACLIDHFIQMGICEQPDDPLAGIRNLLDNRQKIMTAAEMLAHIYIDMHILLGQVK